VKPIRRRKGGRRGRRVASLIREVVSRVLVTELSDPRMGLVTVTDVDVSADLRVADVRVSVLGEPKAQQACMEAIAHSRGHVQERVAEAVDMKYCPVLKFHLDESVKRSVAVSALIAKARAEDEAARADRIRRGVEPPDEGDVEPPDEGDAEAPPDDA
jgi:ribosome-binding factor A